MRFLVEQLMLSSLRSAFRRICWIGPTPDFDKNKPILLYANHHTFHDGYVLWLVSKKLLGREIQLWMEDWDNFPIFGAVGARPFPENDLKQRIKTIRRTGEYLLKHPRSTLIYFPEGTLHPPEEGIIPFPPKIMHQLNRILPEVQWWPVAIHLTTHGEAQPTLLLTGGEPHEHPDGQERERLEACLHTLRSQVHSCETLLLGGKNSPNEAWNLKVLRPLFKRYL